MREIGLSRMDGLPERAFRREYRVTRALFNKLLERVAPVLARNRLKRKHGSPPNGETPAKLKLAACLRFLAGGMYYDIAGDHQMGMYAPAGLVKRASSTQRLRLP